MADMYSLDRGDNSLSFEGRSHQPLSLQATFVGFCSRCGGDLSSIAYYRVSGGRAVAAFCDGCQKAFLFRFDESWSFEDESELGRDGVGGSAAAAPGASRLTDLSREELETVFTPAELRDMERCERGEAYTRQNLYRARAKYEKFERLFGVKIEI